MVRSTFTRAMRTTCVAATLVAATLVAATLVAGAARAENDQTGSTPTQTIQLAGSDAGSRFVPLGVGKSVVIDLPRDVRDVLVTDPTIANAVVRTTRRAYVIGVKIGQTNIYFFDAAGKQIAGLDIAVGRDLNGMRAMMRKLLPHTDIKVDGVGEGVVLSGTVANPAESQQAFDVATRLVGDASRVVNNLNIRGRDQVMLKVTVAEIQRDIIKQLGVDISGSLGYGSTVVSFNSTNPFSAYGQPLTDTGITGTFRSIQATLRAMERAGVIRTLAEPTLTAISGEAANFLAGGEFPVPGGFSCDPTTRSCQTQVQFKKFGVGLTFTPVVLSEGRISLRVMSEVSELTNENALTLTQSVGTSTATLTIPAVRTRRAETTVEIPSGGALAMAGMIQEQTKQQINGVPGILQLPVIGTLFRSRDFVNRQTELVVIVTPLIVRAVAQKDLSRPDDGFADASDPASILLGRINRIYGGPGKAELKRAYHGKPGFILD
jgi:pilus assembly protein CpaC